MDIKYIAEKPRSHVYCTLARDAPGSDPRLEPVLPHPGQHLGK
jgi:hypothetical protein